MSTDVYSRWVGRSVNVNVDILICEPEANSLKIQGFGIYSDAYLYFVLFSSFSLRFRAFLAPQLPELTFSDQG